MSDQDTFTKTCQALAIELKINFYVGRPGRCFRNVMAFAYANPSWTIVHGLAKQCKDGPLLCHAWCETRVNIGDRKHWVVHCPSQHPESPNFGGVQLHPFFYKACRVAFTRRYTFEEAYKQLEKTNNYGPWDPNFLSYC
jgi:hypothetical protein